MKEEIRRIMKLVQEGKLTPDDAAELIEAFNDAPEEEPEAAPKDQTEEQPPVEEPTKPAASPFDGILQAIEKIGHDVSTKVDWNDIASQVRKGVGQGVDAIKKAADEAKLSGGLEVIFGSQESKSVLLALDIPAGKTLRVEGTDGKIVIKGGAETGSLSATARFRAYNAEEAKKKAADYTPMVEENDQFVTIKLHNSLDSMVDAEILIPATVPVEVRHSSGEVEVSGMTGAVRIHNASGNVKLKDQSGAIEVTVSSGDVLIESSSAPVTTIESKSGSVKLHRPAGVVSIRTSSGDVSIVEGACRTLSIDAASGDVSVDLTEPVTGSVAIRAVSGDVGVEIPDGGDCRVNLSTLQGEAMCMALLEDRVQNDQTRINGRLGDGSGLMELSTVSGNVSLHLRDTPVTE